MSKVRRGEEVEIDPRRTMTPARKKRIWEAWEGRCWFCNMPVPMEGEEVEYDHVHHLWLKGSDADKAIGPMHAKTCHKLKTAKDAKIRAKTKRLQKKHVGEQRPTTRPLKSRGFDKRFSKGLDGKIRARKHHHRERNDRDEDDGTEDPG